jgi:hypothetical protein
VSREGEEFLIVRAARDVVSQKLARKGLTRRGRDSAEYRHLRETKRLLLVTIEMFWPDRHEEVIREQGP